MSVCRRWTRTPRRFGAKVLAIATSAMLVSPGALALPVVPAAARAGAPAIVAQAADPASDRVAAEPARRSAEPEVVPGEVLVAFRRGTTEGKAAKAHARAGVAAGYDTLGRSRRLARVKLRRGVTIEDAKAAYRGAPDVAYVQPNYVYHAARTPDDPRFSELWGLDNTGQTGGTADDDIDAPEAWESQTGTTAVVVGDIDSGVDYTHPDLADNVWTNPGEIADNGIDDDGNGYTDDIHGYDFVNDDGDPMDDNGHGTHTAGTIGARGDNATGIAGVCWRVRIMALKFLDAAGEGNTANAVLAIEYASAMGADLTNNSWSGGGYDQALSDAIAGNGRLFVAAAGNDRSLNDIYPSYPASYELPNILAVGATDSRDSMAPFSNYGPHTTDVGAPGVDILSTYPGARYALMSGTSMATPHVSGIAALLLSQRPGLTAGELREAIEDSSEKSSGLALSWATGGRVNAAHALALVTATGWPAVSTVTTSSVATSSVDLRWGRVWGAQGYRVYDGSSLLATLEPTTTVFRATDLAPGSYHALKVEARAWNGQWTTDGPMAGVTTLQTALMGLDGGAAFTSTTAVSVDSSVDGAVQARFPADAGWVSVAAGAHHAVAVNADASLFAWGLNGSRQVGDGTTTNRLSPTRVGYTSDWATAVAGEQYSMAIKRDGTLWGWGQNTYGALGDGTHTTWGTPVRIGPDSDWAAVAAGWQHTVGIKRDGSLWAWGYNGEGQLGDGTTTDRLTPTRIGTETAWAKVACGDSHTVAVKRDGTLWAWGWNAYGQLGDTTASNRSTPTRIGNASNWATPSAGYYHSLAIRTDGSLWAWGYNGFYALGDGTGMTRYAPKQIGSAYDWATPAAGGYQSLALKRDGSLWAWGFNNNGQLGNGTRVDRLTPGRSGVATGWVGIASCDAHAVGLKSDGSVAGWGYNALGQVGDDTSDDRWTPTAIGRAWSSWQNYATSIPGRVPPGDGPKTLDVQYRAASGDVITLTDGIEIETVKPTSMIAGLPQSGISSGPVTFSLSATDTQSGIGTGGIRYAIDSRPTAVYGGPVTLSEPGTHTIAYWAVDRAGNEEVVHHTATVKILGADGSTRYDDTDPRIAYTGKWKTSTSTAYSAGSMHYAETTPATATFYFRGTGFDLISLMSPNYGAATITVDGVAHAADQYASAYAFQRVSYTLRGLADTTHTVTIESAGKATGGVRTNVAIDAIDVVGELLAPADVITRYDDTDPRIAYTGKWKTSTSTAYSAGSMHYAETTPATATFYFRGTGFDLISLMSPNYGAATITVDGVAHAADQYASAYAFQRVSYTLRGLADTTHTVTIESAGKATGGVRTNVAIDAIDVVGELLAPADVITRYDDTDPRIAYTGKWKTSTSTAYSAGSMHYAETTPATATFYFRGTGFDLISLMSPNYGAATITVDGVAHAADQYASAYAFQRVSYTLRGLADTTHTVTIESAGRTTGGARTNVAIDAIDVVGELVP